MLARLELGMLKSGHLVESVDRSKWVLPSDGKHILYVYRSKMVR